MRFHLGPRDGILKERICKDLSEEFDLSYDDLYDSIVVFSPDPYIEEYNVNIRFRKEEHKHLQEDACAYGMFHLIEIYNNFEVGALSGIVQGLIRDISKDKYGIIRR